MMMINAVLQLFGLFLKRNLDIIRGTTSDTEQMLQTILIIISLMHLCWCVFSIIIIIVQ